MIHLVIRCDSLLIRRDPNGAVIAPDSKIAGFDNCSTVRFHFLHNSFLFGPAHLAAFEHGKVWLCVSRRGARMPSGYKVSNRLRRRLFRGWYREPWLIKRNRLRSDRKIRRERS